MKFLIAIPCMDSVATGFAESLLNLEKPGDTKVCFKTGSLIYDSRNLLSLTAMEGEFDRVLWLDSDMSVPPDALARLAIDMSYTDADMVTGLYFRRKFPVTPVIFRDVDSPKEINGTMTAQVDCYKDYPKESLFQVGACGFGCVLMKVDLLKKLWKDYGPPFSPVMWAGEDITFCWHVKQAGGKIMCDSKVKCGHIGSITYGEWMAQKGDAE